MAGDPAASPAHRLPRWELVLMIACLMALNAAAIDIFIPALQAMGAALDISDENRRQWVISSYLLGFGGTQLLYGPLSDRFGRRPVLLFGLGVYVATSFAAVLASSFWALLALRFLQGVGTAATRVIAVTVVRDSFSGARMASVMSIVMMVFMVVPVVAPNVGQAIMLVGDWQEIFLAMAAFGVFIAVWAGVRLPETLHGDYRRSLRFGRIAEAFGIVLTNRHTLGYTMALAFVFGGLFGFINQAEQVFVGAFDLGDAFTLAFSAVAIFMAGASFTNSRLVERIGMRRMSHTALSGFAIFSGSNFAVALAFGGAPPFWVFMVLMAGLFFCFGFLGTNFNAIAMEPLGHVAGTASSVLGFFQTFVGGLIGAAIGYAFNGTVLPLLAGLFFLSLAAMGSIFVGEGFRLFAPDEEVPITSGLPAPR